jgi:DinB superfamily/Pentapeptide repeats (8 copies)
VSVNGEGWPAGEKVFAGTNLTGADFRDVDLTNARITGLISGLIINEVEVEPLIHRELDRMFPERVRLRSEDPKVLAEGWDELVRRWKATIGRAAELPVRLQKERVRGEWSVVETLRHLVFVIDDWFRRTIMAISEPYWTAGLPPTFITPPGQLGIDVDASPPFSEVREVIIDRMGQVSDYVHGVSESELLVACGSCLSAGPDTTVTVIECLHAVLDEAWAHHGYAVRDLDVIAAADD